MMITNPVKYKKLSDIKVGQVVEIKKLLTDSTIKRRLQDLGIIENSIIKCVLSSPSNDPIAYFVRGSVIALRKDISKNILVLEV